MTMIERMDAIEARLRVVEERIRPPALGQREVAALTPPLGSRPQLSTVCHYCGREGVSVDPAAAPAVPDDLWRELQEAGEELDAGAGVILAGCAEIQVEKRAWKRFASALRRVRFARAMAAREGSGVDMDGAISGTDSGAISWGVERQGDHLFIMRGGEWICQECGQKAGYLVHNGAMEVGASQTPCPARSPTGSGPGGS